MTHLAKNLKKAAAIIACIIELSVGCPLPAYRMFDGESEPTTARLSA